MTNRIPIRRLTLSAIVLSLFLATACTTKPDPPVAPATPTASAARHVTFVQWTDPHVFDAGKGRHAEGVREEELDDWAAFHWAVLQTNQLVLTEKRSIDFVVITGDFGLENVQLPDEQSTSEKNTGCANRKASDEGPIDRVPLADAAISIARELDALLIKKVYLVPGNNDLCDEKPTDLRRWAEFVAALQQALAKLQAARVASLTESAGGKLPAIAVPAPVEVFDLTDSLARLYDGQGLKAKDARIVAKFPKGQVPPHFEPPAVNGITLLGLDTAFFKNSDSSADTDIAEEIKWVGGKIQAGGSYLVFTHIPDLKDPYVPAGGKAKDSWKLPGKTPDDWKNNIMSQSGVIGLFAGHFHTANRDIYPHNFAYSTPDELTAAKLWLAPPLAEKYQWRSPPEKTARGMLLVNVNGDGDTRVSHDPKVQSSAIWYSTLDPTTASVGDDKLAEARADERDGQWDEAAKAYQAVVGNSAADSRTHATALSGYLRAKEKMRSWTWQSPVARWLRLNGLPLLYSAGTVTLLLAGMILFNWAIKWVLKLLGYSGRAIISDTMELTIGAPVKEFSARLQAEANKVKHRLIQEKEGWAASHITLLTPAASSMDSLLDSIPKVEAVNISEWVKFLLAVLRAFRWSVKTGLAVFPPNQPLPAATPAPPADGIVPNAELNAYAVLQWGWIVRVSWLRKRKVGADRSALKDLARELAELILGEAFV